MEENKVLEQEAPQAEAPVENEDELKKAVEEQLSKVRTQSMLIGAQTACTVILQKITAAQQNGKMSYRDYERLIKDISTFCRIGISRKVDADGTTSEHNEIIAEEKTSEETNE